MRRLPGPRLAERVKYSALGRWAALPLRARIGLGAVAGQLGRVARWLVHSREWANYSYDYEPEGLAAVASAIAVITGTPVQRVRAHADELIGDVDFAARYRQRVTETRLRHICDPTLHYGRCLVNYMLVRASGARVVFEAGTDRGLSTWAMCRALQRAPAGAAPGLIVTVDIRSDRGEMLEGDEGGLVRRLTGDSVELLAGMERPIDLFLHDTVNDPAHTRAQLAALAPRLAAGGIVHSAWFTREFVDFCDAQGLSALEYVERPRAHWHPGRRCGLAARRCLAPPAP